MVSLEGVADQWEESKIIRQLLRNGKQILRPLKGDETIFVTGKVAGWNYDVLAPLVKKLRNPRGEIQMLNLPSITHESLLQD